MASEAEKGEVELVFFERFAKIAGIGLVPSSARKMLPPAPDVLCSLADGEVLAFELAEACAPEFNAEVSHLSSGGVGVVCGEDVSDQTVLKKLQKRYVTPHPVELLLYGNSATALCDETVVLRVREVLVAGLGPFRRVWYLGDDLHCIAKAEG